MEERLSALGDPSGKQTSDFWDEWFNIVSSENHRSFEWYCDVNEVARFLLHHVTSAATSNGRMIHPGSGNSLLPIKLRDDFGFSHDHVVVDISSVALDEMRNVHDKIVPTDRKGEIEYLLGNVLEPPLPLEDSSFDVWIDKGLLDALFCDFSLLSRAQSLTLFSEAYRLLRPDGGVVAIITMAEDHSLRLILSGFFAEIQSRASSLHVWELVPLSGDMLPFAFLLQRSTQTREGNDDLIITWHRMTGEVEEIKLDLKCLELLNDEMSVRCSASRESFHKSQQHRQDKTLATIEIKPFDSETDMVALKETIISTQWTVPSTNSEEARNIQVQWKSTGSEVIPIGYGISKLVLQCTIDSDDLDHLVESITAWNGTPLFEDGVQSVDVDWNKTARIAAFPGIAYPKPRQ